jgi:hypothetical protein
MSTSHSTHTPATEGAAPDRRTTIALAVLFTLLFVGLTFTGQGEIASDSSGEKVIKDFTTGDTTVAIGGFGLVITASWSCSGASRSVPGSRGFAAHGRRTP